MKITQGYMLSQFIDIVMEDEQMTGWGRACTIETYNNFLKQPLTEDMFIGDRAIFEEWEEISEREFGYDNYYIAFINYGVVLMEKQPMGTIDFICTNISDLFYFTNGQLKLKNVEL